MASGVNYDVVAESFDDRYRRFRFDEIQRELEGFVGDSGDVDVAEIGCGTGHWLAALEGRMRSLTGLDPFRAMLERARAAAPRARLVRGRADALPWLAQSFDRLFCVHALHHFGNVRAFLSEAGRVLRPGGLFLTIGLDPHAATDRWWVYDYFPQALANDLARYSSTSDIRDWLEARNFGDVQTTVIQHIVASLPFEAASVQGVTDRTASSQLLVLTDDEYRAGLERLRAERPTLRADLRIYATVARLR